MEWTRSETLALAMHRCTQCHGAGLRFSQKGAVAPCNCVLRAIFRICWDRFVRCVTQEKHLSRVSVEPHAGRSRPGTWGRKDEEYIADFGLIARRTLDDFEYQLFRYHFMLGADWKLCSLRLRTDRGNFFHTVYRIEQKLGRALREVEPYPLFPLDDYFHGPSRMSPARALAKARPARASHLEFPMPIGRTA
jgi:hypothetical protein